MQGVMQQRFVKITSTSAKANIMRSKAVKEQTGEKTVGKRFLAVLLSALSCWAA